MCDLITEYAVQKTLAKKCHMMFAEIAEKKDEYDKLYEQFGKCLPMEKMELTWTMANWL